MPIKAKYNGSYKDITDLMNVDESIDYVLAKTSSSYKRVYTATRSIEDAPPTTFKSIKSGANLTDYRIYGNTSKNILPLSKTPKTETIGDILCEYDGKGTFTFTSNVDNPTYTQDQWFWVPFEEDFDFPVGISDGGHGCIQLNNDFATGYGVTPYFVSFANRDNGEFVSGFNVAGTALNVVDTNYYTEDLEGLPANCIAFQYLQQIGKRTVTIKPALYLDIRTQQPFEPYGESVGDRTANLFDKNSPEIQNGVYVDDSGTFINSVYHQLSPYITCIANYTYRLYMERAIRSNAFGVYVNLWDSNKQFIKNIYVAQLPSEYQTLSIRFIPSENGFITFNFLNNADITKNVMFYKSSTPLPYEPYGYKVPMTVSNGTDTLTTTIYLPEQIKIEANKADVIDYKTQTLQKRKVIYGWHVDPTISDSFNAVTYLEDAAGMTPAAMGASTFSYGSWENAFFMPKPCMLKSDGTVDYYLNPNDYTKKADGTPSDVANSDYDGNAMMEWRKIWYKFAGTEIDGEGYFYVSNYKVDDTYHCWCNYDSEDNEIDHFYTAIYNGTSFMNYSASKTYVVNDFAVYDNKLYKCNTDIATAESFDNTKWDLVSNTAPAINKMRSLSGIRLTNNNGNAQTDTTTEVTRAEANNTTAAKEWYIETFSDRLLINGLLVLMGKSLNTQAIFGRGLDSGSRSIKEAYITGALNDKGLFYGVTGNGNSAVKVFGMENFWGCAWHRTAGLITNNHAVKLKLTYGTKDGSTVIGYNQTGNGYIDNGTAPYSNGYVQKMSYNKYGFMPAVVTGGSQSTYYADYHYQNATYTGIAYALFGGASGSDLSTGAFYLSLRVAPRNAYWSFAASLSCKPLAGKNPTPDSIRSITLPALPTLTGTNVLSVGTEVQPSKIDITGHIKTISGGS